MRDKNVKAFVRRRLQEGAAANFALLSEARSKFQYRIIGLGYIQRLGRQHRAETQMTRKPVYVANHLEHGEEGGNPRVLIPDNDLGIAEGWQDVVALLRKHAADPDAIRFISDMIEV